MTYFVSLSISWTFDNTDKSDYLELVIINDVMPQVTFKYKSR